jgi:peptidoglycan/LPS O-acetylase OafA/YrhL
LLASGVEHSSGTKYLPHIDGLRALAVLSVFVYHLVPNLAAGGFMGVDIFFVISGFLITRIIKDKAADNKFSLSGFYIRRVRRILPAQLATVFITLLIGLVILSPAKLTELANTGIWSLTGLSNFYFYNHLGYFDLDADSQLFLHTWSLAVEEQFYLLWPSLLLLILALGKKNQNNALLSLVVLGMAISFWLTKTNPNAAFYMMPSRMGEFAFGAILNFFTFSAVKGLAARVTADLALFVLVVLLIFLPDTVGFPGLIVYLACLCTSALILVGDKGSVSSTFLQNRASLKIGKISYSLYLIHWPLILYSRELNFQLEGISIPAILVVGIFLAVISEKFIERPFRTPTGPCKTDLSVAASAGLAVVLVSFVLANILAEKGYPGRLRESNRFVAESIESEKEKRFAVLQAICTARGWKTCKTRSTEKPNVLILGDSQAVDGLNILYKFSENNHYIQDSGPSCTPMTLESFTERIKKNHENYQKCKDNTLRYSEPGTYQNIDTVVLSAHYEWPSDLRGFLKQLRTHYEGGILVFGNSPNFSRSLPEIAMSTTSTADAGREAYRLLMQDENYHQEIEDIAAAFNARYVPITSLLCSDKRRSCNLYVADTTTLISYDHYHLSKAAADWIGLGLKHKYKSWKGLFSSVQ